MFRNRIIAGVISAGAASAISLFGGSSASAHVTAQMYGSTATSGGYGFTFLRVPHGCAGDATNKITVHIPEGVTAVKPQSKAGWTLSKVKDSEGNITEVSWSKGILPSDEFDDFGLSVKWPTLADGIDMQKVYFPTVQTCDGDVLVSTSGKSTRVTLSGGATLEPHAKVGVYADGVRVGPGKVKPDGTFTKAFPASKVPAGAVVELRIAGETVASSEAGEEAWVEIPTEGQDSHALSRPAPAVAVMAAGASGH